MVYKCENCHYLFSAEKPPEDQIGKRYRCPDCGKFGVRAAIDAEIREFNDQQIKRGEEDQ